MKNDISNVFSDNNSLFTVDGVRTRSSLIKKEGFVLPLAIIFSHLFF
ncbi:MAG: hypothetical protein NTZ60_02665 [Campylobacterales bacterium]|nr:hypothetical protein [Campylobacterales bacterium]